MGQINFCQYTVSPFSEHSSQGCLEAGTKRRRAMKSRARRAEHCGATTDRKEGR
jgi:hypothetical protein